MNVVLLAQIFATKSHEPYDERYLAQQVVDLADRHERLAAAVAPFRKELLGPEELDRFVLKLHTLALELGLTSSEE